MANPLKFDFNQKFHSFIAVQFRIVYSVSVMRDTKHLGKHANKLAEQAKEKALFRSQRKAVEAGAHGTLDYTIKEGVNKNKIAGEKIIKSKK